MSADPVKAMRRLGKMAEETQGGGVFAQRASFGLAALRAYGITPDGVSLTDAFAADVYAILSALQAAEAENERLRLAILGGEDVPGVAMSLSVEEILAALRARSAQEQANGG